MNGHRVVTSLGSVCLLTGLVGLSAGATSVPAHAAVPTPTFAVPVPSGIQGYGFEQDLRIDPSNPSNLYTSSPNSLSSATSFIWKSSDGGQTFKLVRGSQQPQGKPQSCVGGGDTELAVDSAGHVYFNDLTLANFSTSRSDDGGATWVSSCTGVPQLGVDRQWYAVHGDATTTGYVALASDEINQSNPLTCPTGGSAVGGNILTLNLSPVSAIAGATAGVQFAPAQALSCDEGIMGNDEVYDYGANGGQKVFVVHDNSAFTSVSMARCDVVGVSNITPTGVANCQDKVISSFPGSVTGGSFATMSVDSHGNLYAVWEQATGSRGTVTGNVGLRYAYSTDQGNNWTVSSLPTPGLNNNVFAWIAAGDPGKVDVAWYGTPANEQGTGGPDTTHGDWSLWMAQTLNNGASWTAPILASDHFMHRGTIQTVMGGQAGDRTLGDFIQLRIGAQGEANISYGDSNNIDEVFLPQATFVRQNGGSSVYDANPGVTLPARNLNSVTDVGGDGIFENLGQATSNIPNLDLLGSSISQPDANHYTVTMKVADLTSLLPPAASLAASAGPDLVWQTQWHVPSTTDPNGGKLFFAYMESNAGGAPTCWDGENAAEVNGGGVTMTYPGAHQLTGAACTYTATAPGTITITVPTADVAEANPLDSNLYSAASSTQIVAAPPDSVPSLGGTGGEYFSLVDVTPSYDVMPVPPGGNVPEAPLSALLTVVGAAAVGWGVRRRRRKGGSVAV